MSAGGEASLTLESRLRHGGEVLFQELQGEAVLLDLASGMYFGLDEVGTRIWQLIGERERLADVARAIVDEFDVDEERCVRDLLGLAEQLRGNALVTRVG